MEGEHYSFVEFRKKHITPWFRQIRYRTHVSTSARYAPCCQWHALDEFESFHDYEPPILPVIAYTANDQQLYENTGDLYVLFYGVPAHARDWVYTLAASNGLSLQYDSMVCDNCELWVVSKKYTIRPRMRQHFYALVWMRVYLHRLLRRIYRPPEGRMFLKLRDEACGLIQ